MGADWSERLLKLRYKAEVGVLCEAPVHYSQMLGRLFGSAGPDDDFGSLD